MHVGIDIIVKDFSDIETNHYRYLAAFLNG